MSYSGVGSRRLLARHRDQCEPAAGRRSLGRCQLEEHRTVRRDRGFVRPVERAKILLPPDVANSLRAAQLQLCEVGGDLHLGESRVEQADGARPVFELLEPDLPTRVTLRLCIATGADVFVPFVAALRVDQPRLAAE